MKVKRQYKTFKFLVFVPRLPGFQVCCIVGYTLANNTIPQEEGLTGFKCCSSILWKDNMFLSRFPFRLIRQSWTKSYSTVSVEEVEALKKKTFYSVHTRNDLNMSAPGFPLSSARLNVSEVLIVIRNDVNGDENVKNSWFHKQNNNFARVSRFFVHFFPVFARLRRENA